MNENYAIQKFIQSLSDSQKLFLYQELLEGKEETIITMIEPMLNQWSFQKTRSVEANLSRNYYVN